jgi:hypothetical protein
MMRPRLLRLPASSLVEVTVATTILVLVFGLALGSFARLSLTGPRQFQLRGQQLVGSLAAETVRQHAWHAISRREGVIALEQEVLPYARVPHLWQLRVTASVRGREIARLQQLIYAPSHVAAP